MAEDNIIIIGAGAAGLIAARQLSRTGNKVVILEARRRTGGRIHTFRDKNFRDLTEGGAEFMHGKLETTMSLLKEYKIKKIPAKGNIWHVKNNEIEKDKDIVTEHHHLLRKKLKELKRDTTLKQFLNRHFKESKFKHLWKDVTGFVEGYESASVDTFSTFAFREDWLEAEEWKQFRIEGGYGTLTDKLAEECKQLGCRIIFSSVVKKIKWKKGLVEILCTNGKQYTGEKCVITVPLGVLQKKKIQFNPALQAKTNAARSLGYGYVIKILLLFRNKFWEEQKVQALLNENINKLFFLFSDAPVPTWWTQYPSSNALLTGWYSGPKAAKSASKSNREILDDALSSLSEIFKIDKKQLRSKLKAWKVMNWVMDEFSLGSYSYATVAGNKHKKQLEKNMQNTLFFAGEYLEEPAGTVEAALVSGMKVAKQLTPNPSLNI